MGLGGSLLVKAAALAAVSASSLWASLEDKASGNLLVRALAVERQLGRLRR